MSAAAMASYPLDGILEGSFFSEPVYLDKNFILATPEIPFTAGLIKTLHDWDFNEVFTAGTPHVDYAEHKADKESAAVSAVFDKEQLSGAESFIKDLQGYVQSVFDDVQYRNLLDYDAMTIKMKGVCDYLLENKSLVLRAMRNISSGSDYLVSHTERSVIFAIIIGSAIKLPQHRLTELGIAAVVHEIGMLQLPQELYLSDRPLNQNEKNAIMTHPVLGYKFLKGLKFPLAVTLPALEHHERENGGGYPRRVKGDMLNLYSKVITVACSYEALSAGRPHKEAKDGYTGMLELLKNEGKQYDDAIVRALVFSLSIYPIGLYVFLSNGRKGQVVDVNRDNPRFPVVQIFGELTVDGKNKVAETSHDGLHIVRPLTKEEIGQG